MNRRALLLPVLAFIAACQGGETTRPGNAPFSPPSFLIQDGARGGNRDFFFLPPMVSNPVNHADYEATAFNAALQPTVSICALDAATPAAVTAATLCKAPGYTTGATLAGPTGEHYQYNWSVPNSTSDVFYRVKVSVGSTELGFADVQTATNGAGLKNVNTGEFVPMQDGRNLPIKFRIERYALCEVPGTGPCATETVSLAGGGDVTANIPGTTGNSGVEIPPQGTGGTTTITVQPCDPTPENNSLNPSVTDLPVFGPCMRITADPPLPPEGLVNAATVFICDITPYIPGGMDPEQQERITLHRFDAPNAFAALPHAHGCEQQVGFSGSVKGFFGSLAKGQLRNAGKLLVAMVAPRPLYAAAMMLDVGAGGLTEDFSDFQFALPSKLEIYTGNNQVAPPGVTLATNPTVVVKDLGGDVVLGARVRFAGDVASCQSAAAGSGTVSTASGLVNTPWAISATPGANYLVACGRGLAGSDYDGPRNTGDPFQPIQAHFDGADPVGGPVAEPVVTGSVTFTATGTTDPIELVGFGSTFEAFLLGPGGSGVGTSTASPPSGWQSGSGGPTMTAPFGGTYGGCGITSSFSGSIWAENTDYLFTKTFSSPYSGTLKILVWIDNDAQVWLDGDNVTATGSASAAYSHLDNKGNANPSDDWWVHDNCANDAPPTFTIPITAGSHTLAIWGHDRGAVGYMDVKITIQP